MTYITLLSTFQIPNLQIGLYLSTVSDRRSSGQIVLFVDMGGGLGMMMG